VGEAVFWAFLAASTLVVGAAVALVTHPGSSLVGMVMAFGAGALISAAAFELVLEALESSDSPLLWLSMALGGLAFFVGDLLISRGRGHTRKRSTGEQAGQSPLAIVLGAALDGIPESIVLGMSVVLGGSVSVAFLVATALSNFPEGMSATSGLEKAGWSGRSILGLWGFVIAISTASAAIGYAVFDNVAEATGAHVQAFAAGAVIVMLADTMMPEAFEDAGPPVGLATLAGFAVALALSGIG
jgi:ZIP family zinc transporter